MFLSSPARTRTWINGVRIRRPTRIRRQAKNQRGHENATPLHVDDTNNSRPTPTCQCGSCNPRTVTHVNAMPRAPRRNNESKRLSGCRAPSGSAQGPHRRAHDVNPVNAKSRSLPLTVERRARLYATLGFDKSRRLRNTKGGNVVPNSTRRHCDMRPQGTLRCG